VAVRHHHVQRTAKNESRWDALAPEDRRMDDAAIDLFTPVTPRERWHPNFARLADHAMDAEKRVLRAWAAGFRDRDGKFVKEFQTTFNSSFWELYVYAFLRKAGCTVDLSHSRPDFVVPAGPLGAFVAEAVIASNANGQLPEWAGQWEQRQSTDREALLAVASVRLSQAIGAKRTKWEQYNALPQCQGRPYVICVAPFEQPGGQEQGTQAIDRVLFGGPGPLLQRDAEGGYRAVGFATAPQAFKTSGAAIELGLFTDDRFAGVSAVFFSSLATWSKVTALAPDRPLEVLFRAVRSGPDLNIEIEGGAEYEETVADGSHLFINPFARIPIDPDPWFDAGCCTHLYEPTGTLTRVQPRTLWQRFAMRLVPMAAGQTPMAAHVPPAGASVANRAFPADGVYFGGPAALGTCDSVELALHRGWTIACGRDRVDGDWACIFKPLRCLTIQEFIDADGAEMTEFVASRELAVERARVAIDEHLQGTLVSGGA
jgi:hypothetical protein